MADKREIIVDLLARDKSGPATKGFAKNIDDAGKTADKTGGRLGKLDDEIRNVESELVKMAKAFTDANDAGERLDISKAIRRTQSDLRRLNTNRNILKDLLPEPSPAEVSSWSKKIQSALSGAISSGASLGPGTAGIGAAVAAAAPMIGATISGAVIGAAGAGGVIGGLLVASKDARVQGAADAVGTRLSDRLELAGLSFVNPAIKSLDRLEGALDSLDFQGIFADSAKFLPGLTEGVSSAIEDIGNGIESLVSNAGPVMDVLGSGIAGIGEHLGEGLKLLSDNGPAAAAALSDLFSVIDGSIDTVFTFIDGLTKIYEWNKRIGGDGALQLLLKVTGNELKQTSASADDYADSTAVLAKEMSTAEKAALGQRDALDELSKEMRAQTDPVFGLLDAQDKLAAAQTASAKATKDHGAKSKEAQSALRDLAEAAVNLEGKAGALSDTFNGQVTPELNATLRAAGLTSGQIAAVASQFRTARKDGDRFAKNYKADLDLTGYEAATAHAKQVRDMLAQVRSKKVSVTVLVRTSQLDKAENTLDRLGARAAGGPVTKNVPYWVGENGPELVVPDSNARVLSAASSRSAMSSGHRTGRVSAGQGGGHPGVRIELGGDQALVELFRRLIRTTNLLQDT